MFGVVLSNPVWVGVGVGALHTSDYVFANRPMLDQWSCTSLSHVEAKCTDHRMVMAVFEKKNGEPSNISDDIIPDDSTPEESEIANVPHIEEQVMAWLLVRNRLQRAGSVLSQVTATRPRKGGRNMWRSAR